MSKHIGFCPICYDDLRNKCVASPDVCEHTFCFDCLQKSSKLGRFCPVDRKRYRKIINVKSGKSFQVKPCRRKKERVLYDISVYCEICSKSSEGEKLLLCDCCDLGYHCKCLSPPLKSIPSGQWFCPECLAVEERMKKSRGITKEAECSGTQAGYSNFQGTKYIETFVISLDKLQKSPPGKNQGLLMEEAFEWLVSLQYCFQSAFPEIFLQRRKQRKLLGARSGCMADGVVSQPELQYGFAAVAGGLALS
ncbi:PHD and RING finger domain-containing protein 1-like [Stegodyphus dumicola]|uniref:PHD and RING finger domain-containing protein 1-like n=1 Tax=Stegodyphus dumicola TaxID=202533 RepID=UPI0015A768A7|nr:PHD and RING finger domain-containing protein 1-like [Stegodyphus dumicola]